MAIKYYISSLVLIASCLMLPTSLHAQARDTNSEAIALSLNTMVMFALERNNDLKAARERAEQMGYFVEEAKSGYYPQVRMNLQGGQEYKAPGSGRESNSLGKASLTMNQNLFDGYATRAEVSRRSELENSAMMEAETTKEELILQVTEYYLDVMRYQGEAAATEKFVTEIDKIVQTISELFEGGAISKAMFDYALSRQASAYVTLNEARSSFNDAVSNLEFLTGDLPEFFAVIPDRLSPDNLDRDFYIKLASQDNTQIKKVQSDLYAMKYQLRAEKSAYYPEVDLNFKAEQSNNDGGDVGRQRNLKATIDLTYDIFDGFNKDNRVRRVKSQIRELEYQDRQAFNELKKDINLAYNQLSSLQTAINSTVLEIRSNIALQRLNRENFKLGSINAIELIEGEERLNQAFKKKYQLENNLLRNTYSLLVITNVLKDTFFCASCTTDNINIAEE